MALNGSQLGKLIMSQCASKGIIGSEINKFSTGLGEGIVESFIEMNQVQTMDVGMMTTGTGTGKMTGIIPTAMLGMVIPLMMGNGIRGIKMKDIAEAICNAVATHFNAMNEVTTTHTGVALGSGTGKVLGLVPNKMESRIMQKMKANGYTGTMMQPFVNAVSTGICNNIMATAIIAVAISGSPSPLAAGSPIPSSGAGQGKVK